MTDMYFLFTCHQNMGEVDILMSCLSMNADIVYSFQNSQHSLIGFMWTMIIIKETNILCHCGDHTKGNNPEW